MFLTREEIHRLVWDVPGRHLALRFGISDTALSKICRKLDVPRPPPGWWAKKAAGHSVRITPLPEARPGIRPHMQISPAQEAVHGIRDSIAAEAAGVGAVLVRGKLTHPHPLIGGWLAMRREQRAEARRQAALWGVRRATVPDFSAVDRRRHLILHALFRALERRGAQIGEDGRGRLTATLEGEAIVFELREKLRQVTRPLTDEEKRWETWNRSGIRKELQPSSLLHFTISAWTEEPVRKNWQESSTRPIEDMLPEIVATFVVLAPILAERSRQREEAARRWAEQQRRAEEERQRRREDDNRWRRFLEIAAAWKEAALARELISALREGEAGTNELIEGRSVAEWIDWAEQRADALDAVGRKPDALFADVGAVRAWSRLD